MPGTKEGGRNAAATNKRKYGSDYYQRIGKIGGSQTRPETRWFSNNRDAAKEAAVKGGQISRRVWTPEQRERHSIMMKENARRLKNGR